MQQLVGGDVLSSAASDRARQGCEVRLTQHHVGRGAVLGRDLVVDEDAVVLSVSHESLPFDPHALRDRAVLD